MTQHKSTDGLISESRSHKVVDGTALVDRRQELGLTQATFARLCNWSQQYQSMLERPGKHEITTNIAKTIAEIAISENTTD